MSCCAPNASASLEIAGSEPVSVSMDELVLSSRDLGDGSRQSDLSVPGVHCAGCIAAVERTLSAMPGVESARVNLSMKRAAVRWRAIDGQPPDLIGHLQAIGYDAHVFTTESDAADPEYTRLVRALAVAGFCSMNIMLLSVSIWSGAEGGVRQAFHWISALLAMPAIVYSGRIFFASAWRALRHGRTNMDVPISIGVLLAFGLSLYDTVQGGEHAYFDAATSLIFFLLIGRTLDHVMREKARSAVAGLARLIPQGATVIDADGTRRHVPVAQIVPGTLLIVTVGDRVPIDGIIVQGSSDLDYSLVSGEALPKYAGPGAQLQAGLMNLTGPLTIRTTARVENSFLADMVRMMEIAEGGRATYRRLADRASALYAPVVHCVAFLSFLGWMVATGDWHRSITIAIAVLIVTCPCALGLAVPIVQVVAARRLFENGIMVKDGSALERLTEIDTVLFDKTGTLTLGRLRLLNAAEIPPETMTIAGAMALHSRHPASLAIVAERPENRSGQPNFESVTEQAGLGLEARSGDVVYRLGRPGWATGKEAAETGEPNSVSVLAKNGVLLGRFLFADRLRNDAAQTIVSLARDGIWTEIVSGDRGSAVEALASTLQIDTYHADLLPADKTQRINDLSASGRKVLMVGDGLNDAPALASAHVSMAPASAADIGRTASDIVFLHESLSAVTRAITIARTAGRLIRQNFAIAIAYNAVAVPFAVLGAVTPLLAAIAMSLSSIMVVANALRLRNGISGGMASRSQSGFPIKKPAQVAV